ncbi:MAG: hypothetical protein OEW12_01360 [Deltaproteobacteria bacterium]|nr:hypothetical protein [Deltaproteobacteria bacterium]
MKKNQLAALFGMVCFLATTPAWAKPAKGVDETQIMLEAYNLATGKPVYSGKRKITITDGRLEITSEYTGPEGKVIHNDQTAAQADSLTLISFNDTDHRIGRKVDIRQSDGKVAITYQDAAGEKVKKETLDGASDQSIGILLGHLIEKNWVRLNQGGVVKLNLIVADRLGTVGFQIKKAGETRIGEVKANDFQVEPSSWLIRKLVDPLHFVMAQDSHRMVEFRGRTTIPDNKGDPLPVRLVYKYEK